MASARSPVGFGPQRVTMKVRCIIALSERHRSRLQPGHAAGPKDVAVEGGVLTGQHLARQPRNWVVTTRRVDLELILRITELSCGDLHDRARLQAVARQAAQAHFHGPHPQHVHHAPHREPRARARLHVHVDLQARAQTQRRREVDRVGRK